MSKKEEGIPFTKMTGTGNDFIVIDNRPGRFSGNEHAFFNRICRRRFSVGADGVILVEEGESAPVRMRYFNADGKEAAMCGNGGRCVAFYAVEKGIVRNPEFTIQAQDGLHKARVEDRHVSLSISPARDFKTEHEILKEKDFQEGGFLNVSFDRLTARARFEEGTDASE